MICASGHAGGENLRRQLVYIRAVRNRGYTVRVLRISHLLTMSVTPRIGNHNRQPRQRQRPSGNRTRRISVKKIGFLTLLIMAALLFTLAFAFPAAAAAPKGPAVPVPAGPAGAGAGGLAGGP